MYPPTLSAALSRYLLVDRSAQTQQTYERFLTRFVADIGPGRPLELITTEDIYAYIQFMRARTERYADHPSRPTERGKLSAVTIYKNVKMIKTFFLWCVRIDLLEVSPAAGIVNSRPVRPLGMGKAATDEELELLLVQVG